MKINTYMYIFNSTLLFYFFLYVNFSFYMEFIHFLLKELLIHCFMQICWHWVVSYHYVWKCLHCLHFPNWFWWLSNYRLTGLLETFVLRKLWFSVVLWLTELFKFLFCLCSSMDGPFPLCLLWFSALCYEIPWDSFLQAFLVLRFTDQLDLLIYSFHIIFDFPFIPFVPLKLSLFITFFLFSHGHQNLTCV